MKSVFHKKTIVIFGLLFYCHLAVCQSKEETKAEIETDLLEEVESKFEILTTTGSRNKFRTLFDASTPIEIITKEEIKNTGQANLDQILNFRIPSFNAANQTVSDATAHFDPSELRNLGSSRTLILINGKRKNQSALVHVNDTPGKGEVGIDLKSIPAEAIKRIEILRDGATTQYGSDAIAGVINIILKEEGEGEFSAQTGITTLGDGLSYQAAFNKSFKIEEGFLNLTGSYYHQDYTNRAGEPGTDIWLGQDSSNSWIMENPDLGVVIGQPAFDKFSLFGNFGTDFSNGLGHFYIRSGYTFRDGKSFAIYQPPYFVTDDAGLLTPPGTPYQGFLPTFETQIEDLFFTFGNQYNFSGWTTNISLTIGSNSVDYTIGNSINVRLLPNSPTRFDAGGYTFENVVGNLDFSKKISALTLSFGSEIRREDFEIRAGQEASFINGGAQSFSGIQPQTALEENRNNVGIYGSVDIEPTRALLLNGAIRYENYSDFGENISWSVSGRYKLGKDRGVIRASVSTGFRAPSLHQIYISNIRSTIESGTVLNQGIFNKNSSVINALEIPSLTAETSMNISAGFTYKFTKNISLTTDLYTIKVDDRIILSSEIRYNRDSTPTNVVETILNANNITALQFFSNGLNTRT